MSKKVRSEANRVACLIKANKAEYYIADMDLEDNTSDVVDSVPLINKTLGKLKSCYLLISAGVEKLIVVGYVPIELSDNISIEEWVNESVKNITGNIEKSEVDNGCFWVCITTDTPFKLKDIVRSNGFAYLKTHELLNEEESSEEFVGFDDI